MSTIYNVERKMVATQKVGGRVGKCLVCGRDTEATTQIPSQPNGVKVCEECVGRLLPYSYKNEQVVGTKGKEPTIGWENEVDWVRGLDHEELRQVWAMLYTYHFIPTSDCTVNCEFKSPIYNSLSAFTKACGGIEYLANKGYINLDSNRTGSHLHIARYNGDDEATITPHDVEAIERIIRSDDEKAKRLFGRSLGANSYCGSFDRSCPSSHGGWFTFRPNTVEWRLCKFRSAEQYVELVKALRKVTYAKNPVKAFKKWWDAN